MAWRKLALCLVLLLLLCTVDAGEKAGGKKGKKPKVVCPS